jgi:hypothetical protein
MSVVLAGLFPPVGTTMEWNRKLNWQPIPAESQPLNEDSVIQYFQMIPPRVSRSLKLMIFFLNLISASVSTTTVSPLPRGPQRSLSIIRNGKYSQREPGTIQ